MALDLITLRTVFRETQRSRQISLIFLFGISLGPCMDGPLARALFSFCIPVGRGHVYGVSLQHYGCAP